MASAGKGTGKRLNESQRLQVIAKLQRNDAPSKRALAREYDVSEGAIRKIWNERQTIQQRTAMMSDTARKNSFRSTVGRFQPVEDALYEWLESMRRAKLAIPPSLTIAKAKEIADSMGVEDFKASWQWLKNFRTRRGINSMMLQGEAGEIDREDPDLLDSLSTLCEIIDNYDAENVYNMDETGLFYRVLPRYTLLMPNEDVQTTRGLKKTKDRCTLIVCANATGSHKIPCAFIGKSIS
jgi:Tc5 transposase DNA-binding domain